jgi:hypothetical protein
MSFEEIYQAIYVQSDVTDCKRAQDEIVHMSDTDWNDWVEYRNARNRGPEYVYL